MTTRIADLAQNMLVLRVITETKSRINDAQLQISTGQKSQDYAGIADVSGRLVTLEDSVNRTDQFLTDNTFVNLRINTMLNSVDQVQKTVDKLKGLVRDVLDDGNLPAGTNKDDLSQVYFNEIKDALNVSVNGRHLFAGSKTDVAPVANVDLSSAPTNSGPPDYTTVAEPSYYYQGDDTVQKARIDEGVVLNYGVNASNPAFEKVIRAVRILRSTPTDGSDPNYIKKYQDALNLLNDATDNLSSVQLSLGTQGQQLAKTNQKHADQKTFFQTVISDLESADTAEAVAKVNQDQATLEASYSTLVRLSGLSLTKYL